MVSVLSFPAYQNKMESYGVCNMGFGHYDGAWQIFALKSERVMGMGYLTVVATLSLIRIELG